MTVAEFIKKIQGYYSLAYGVTSDGVPTEFSRRVGEYLARKSPRFLDVLLEEVLRRHPASFRCLPDLAVFTACEPAVYSVLEQPAPWAPALDELPLSKDDGALEIKKVRETIERLAEARTFQPKHSAPAQPIKDRQPAGGEADRETRIAMRRKLVGIEGWARLTANGAAREDTP